MTVQDSDKFLVDRGGTNYQLTSDNLMAELLDDDLMLVSRGGTNYKATGADIKGSLNSLTAEATVTPIEPTTADLLTCTVVALGGTPPYTYTYQWYNRYGTIYGWTPYPGSTDSTLQLTSDNLGRNFKCYVTVTDSLGIEKEVASNETVAAVDAGIAPVLESVSLVENDPSTDPRFTSSSFTVATSLSEEGNPVSEKVIDAHVDGSIRSTDQFDEPLESTTTISGLPPTTWSDSLTAPSGVNNPQNAFDGGANRSTATGGIEVITFTLPKPITGQISFSTGLGSISHECYTNGALSYTITTGGGGVVNWDVTNATSVGIKCTSQQTGIVAIYLDNVEFIDGVAMPGGGVEETALNFAASANMAYLEAGDAVEQPEQEIKPQNLWSAFLQANSGFNSPVTRAFDGDFDESAVGTANGEEVYFQPGGTWTGTVSFRPASYSLNVSHDWYINNIRQGSKTPDGDGLITFDVTNAGSFGIRVTDGSQSTVAAMYWDGGIMIDNQAITAKATGTVGSITNTVVTLSSSSGTWTNSVNVTGPTKTIVEENVRKYLQFDSNGNISDLLDAPQDPPYSTTDANPGLTLTFPATFPSGEAPDDELAEGTTLTVTATASNTVGSSGPLAAIVQPVGGSTGPNLTGVTTLYTGNNGAQDIVNGCNLAATGGMVWTKNRDDQMSHYLVDTERGRAYFLKSDSTATQSAGSPENTDFVSFNSDGYSLGANWDGYFNNNTRPFVSWTFQKAEGYFDVIKKTLGASPETISHSLGTNPGFIIAKKTDSATNWMCWQKDLASNEYLMLNESNSVTSIGLSVFYDVTTDSFKYNPGAADGAGEYVFYVFAADSDYVKCGSWSGTNNNQVIDTGFSPQWILYKSISNTSDWVIRDISRGDTPKLNPNESNSESADNDFGWLDGGFIVKNGNILTNAAGSTYVYVAIAAPPTRSLTTEEFAQQSLRLATYQNRKEVKCGEMAEASRDALIQEMADRGYELTDILNYL